jgi:hypothetical protein
MNTGRLLEYKYPEKSIASNNCSSSSAFKQSLSVMLWRRSTAELSLFRGGHFGASGDSNEKNFWPKGGLSSREKLSMGKWRR